MSQQYDNDGKIAVWKNDSDNERAPVLTGHIYIPRDAVPGQKMRVAFWKGDGDRAPVLRGSVEAYRDDKAQAPAQAPAPQATQASFDESDVPF